MKEIPVPTPPWIAGNSSHVIAAQFLPNDAAKSSSPPTTTLNNRQPLFPSVPANAPLLYSESKTATADGICEYFPALHPEVCTRLEGLPASTPPQTQGRNLDLSETGSVPRSNYLTQRFAPPIGTNTVVGVPEGAPINPADWTFLA